MLNLKMKVGHYYYLKLNKDQKIAFAILYGFERGKNKNVYTTMMFTGHGNFEFPIEDDTFNEDLLKKNKKT